MSVNNMAIEDVYALLNSLHEQATGVASLTATNIYDFVSQANTTLAAGNDIVYNALMKTIGRTIFASRPYNAKFTGLEADSMRWGGIVRKISHGDVDIDTDKVYHDIVMGQSVDMFTRKQDDVLETRFYGSDVYQDFYTTYKKQLFDAFSSPEQLGSFVSQKTAEMSNKWEQYREELARMSLANFIAAKTITDAASCIHLLTEYNTLTGLSLTAQQVWQPANIEGFFKFVRARINTLGRKMAERSEMFQVNIAGHHIKRHTPFADLRIFLSADALDMINTMVDADVYHDEPLKYPNIVEGVSYWQAIDTPMEINVAPSYIDATGVVVNGTATNVADIFGVMIDKDAVAYSVIDYSVDNTPLNARGQYWNTFLTSNTRYTNDLTEKGIVLLLD